MRHQWQKQSGAYFLTHMHGDHIKGLGSTWSRGPLYCSHVTAQLLCVRFPGFSKGLLRPLEVGVHTMVEVWGKQQRQELMEVTPIDAHHCPGSVMFLFRGSFGTRLHTGDFRWDAFLPTSSSPAPSPSRPLPETSKLALTCSEGCADEAARPLTSGLRQLQEALQGRPVDVLFLDNTYCHPMYWFPNRAEALEQVCAILEAHPRHQVLIGVDSLGKEDLLVSIATRLRTKIAVSPERLAFARVLGLPDVFTLLPGPSIYATAPPSARSEPLKASGSSAPSEPSDASPTRSERSEPVEASRTSSPSEPSDALQSSNASEPSGPSATSGSGHPAKPSTSEPSRSCGPSDSAERSQPLEPPEVSETARPRICAVPRRSVNFDHLRVLNARAPTIGIVPSGWRSLDRQPGEPNHRGAVPGHGNRAPGSRVSGGTAQVPIPGFGNRGWPTEGVSKQRRSDEAEEEGRGCGTFSNEEQAELLRSAMPAVTPAADVLTSARECSGIEGAAQDIQERHLPSSRRKGAVQVQGAAAAARERLKKPLPEPSAPREPLLFRVPYSLHSCFVELDAFVRLVRPSVIRPIAGKDPYGLDTCPNAHFGELCKQWGQGRGLQEPHPVLAEVSANPVCADGVDRVGFVDDGEDALVLRGKRNRKRSALPKVRRVVIRSKRFRVCSISPPKASASVAPKAADFATFDEGTGPLPEERGGLRPGGLGALDSGVNTLLDEQDLLRGLAGEWSSGLHNKARLRASADTDAACLEWDVRREVKQEEFGKGVAAQVSSPERNLQRSETQVGSNEQCLSKNEAGGLASVLPDWYIEAHDRWIADASRADTCCESAAAAAGCKGDLKAHTGQHRGSKSSKRTLPRFFMKAGQTLGN
ncbi:hypothetical protein KFL_003970110 [Klebsormidium nitens]|uniref:Protein artemis n=1 Tax=Klebsormidium nitens TaxID=105231 RepID=A0A1Y1IAS2_KLENI|nr:hypothetical protein KFL_003970110 [Klebsormidium nitens]|eukprot:GAQ88064.1 hypothetical protein KFL_003970110 [Klebsormidium nitens]